MSERDPREHRSPTDTRRVTEDRLARMGITDRAERRRIADDVARGTHEQLDRRR